MKVSDSVEAQTTREKMHGQQQTVSGDTVVVLRNPLSGTARKRSEVRKLLQELTRNGFQVRLFSSRERLERFVRRLEPSRLRCVVAAGGDGTVNDLLNRLPGVPLALLPLGTENLLARYVGVSSSGRQAAQVIVHGVVQQFDVGQVNGRRFLLMASVGLDAQVVHQVHRHRTGPVSKWSYVRPILAAARTYLFPQLQVTVWRASASNSTKQKTKGRSTGSNQPLPFSIGEQETAQQPPPPHDRSTQCNDSQRNATQFNNIQCSNTQSHDGVQCQSNGTQRRDTLREEALCGHTHRENVQRKIVQRENVQRENTPTENTHSEDVHPEDAHPEDAPTENIHVGNTQQESFSPEQIQREKIPREHAQRGDLQRENVQRESVQGESVQTETALLGFHSEGVWSGEAGQVVVCNLPVYALGLQFCPNSQAQDGLLNVCLFPPTRRLGTLRNFLEVFCGARHVKRKDVTLLSFSVCRVTSDQPVPVQVDGDPCGYTPVEITLAPIKQPLLVPSAALLKAAQT